MVHPPTSALDISICKKSNPFYRLYASKKSPTVLLIRIISNRTLLNSISMSIKGHKNHHWQDWLYYLCVCLLLFALSCYFQFSVLNSHVGRSGNEFFFGTTPDIIYFIQYKFFCPFLLYGSQRDFPSTNDQLGW